MAGQQEEQAPRPRLSFLRKCTRAMDCGRDLDEKRGETESYGEVLWLGVWCKLWPEHGGLGLWYLLQGRMGVKGGKMPRNWLGQFCPEC